MKNCPACKKENSEIAIHCEFCEYPFEGTEKEKAIHIGKFISKKGVKYDKDDSLIRSQKIIGFIAVTNLLFLGVTYKLLPNGWIISHLIIVGIFLFCALTIRKHSFIKVLIPLIIISLPTILLLIINPLDFIVNISINTIFIVALVYSLILVRSHQKFVDKFGE